MNYNTLIEDIRSELNRSDESTINNIPKFIFNAHHKICRECKNIGFEQYVTSAFIPGVAVIPKPGRWRRTITFNFGTGDDSNTRKPILLQTYEYLTKYWPNRLTQGEPKFYADYGFYNFLVAPTPDSNYPFEIAFLEIPQPLTEQNQTNWLTNFAPDVLFYGSLLQSAPFLKDDDRINTWRAFYDQGVAQLIDQDKKRYSDRTTERESD
jgi:hypothetical protein